jgi:hypothetical protein
MEIKTNLVCIRCSPPHIKGVCDCEKVKQKPKYIPIKDWLNIDESGHRTFLNKYKDLINSK